MSETLDSLAKKAANCMACSLSEQRTQVVFGVGNPSAKLLLIGEAPGRDEDIQGEPFVGKAGKLLDRMMYAVGLDRSQVYIMNILRCRPPNNRDPRPEEVSACQTWFDQQWALINPEVVGVLGRVAAQHILQTDASMRVMRGSWHQSRGANVRVLYHPAYLLRSSDQKKAAWEDFLELKKKLII